MKVLIIGLPYFSAYIQKKLQAHFPAHQFVNLNTYYHYRDKIRFAYHLPSTDVVYSINGATHGSRSIDWALKLHKKIVFHWVGSDLMNAKVDFQKGIINADYIQKVTHLTDTPWFVQELADIDIKASFAPLNAVAFNFEVNPELPDTFSVLTYIKQGSEFFYGIDTIISLAMQFPQIVFNIAGMDHFEQELPSNIKLLGWVDDMRAHIKKNWLSLRMPIHDGLSFFVIESLAEKRYVIYNQLFQPSLMAKDADSAAIIIQDLWNQFKANTLGPNLKGSSYIQKHFNEKQVLSTIFNALSSTE
jgi:hypothetical protein